MKNYILSRIFIDVFHDLSTTSTKNIPKLVVNDLNVLENTLQEYLVSILGIRIKNNYEEHYREIRKYFENIFNNIKYETYTDFIEVIKQYGEEYKAKISNHPYTELFLESMQTLYSCDYDGRVHFFDHDVITPGGGY